MIRVHRLHYTSLREASLCYVALMSGLLLLAVPLASQEYLQSETCHGTGNCSVHALSCDAGQRMAVVEASYGFQVKEVFRECEDATNGNCTSSCCSYNSSSDCKQDFSGDALERVRSECSHSPECQINAPRADNTACSPAVRARNSSYSVLRAVCVPEAVTVDPCTDATVSDNLVSLHLSHSSNHTSNNTCQCYVTTITTNTTNNNSTITTNNNNTDNVEVTAYDVQASTGSGCSVRVTDGGGRVVMDYSGAAQQFPAASVTVTSLPLAVTFSFDDVISGGPRRVWLGFRGESPSVRMVMRCGQNAVDYGLTLNTEKTTTQTRETCDTTPTTTTTTTTNSNNHNNNNNNNHHETPKVNTVTPDDPQRGTTDIIMYAAIGLCGLLFLSFTYVCFKKIRKKGCPKWCPAPCRDLESGKSNDRDPDNRMGANGGQSRRHSNVSGLDPSTDSNSSSNNNSIKGGGGEKGLANGAVTSSEVKVNGQAFREREKPISYISQREFKHKRHRSFQQSLHRTSFGSLENITETEEESKFPTHHNHSNINLEEAFKILDQKLRPLESENVDEEEMDDVFENTDTGPNTDSAQGTPADQHVRAAQSGPADRVSDQGDVREGEEDEGEQTEDDEDSHGSPVMFSLGDGSQSSDPDLENYLSRL